MLGVFSRSQPVGGRSFQVVSCCKITEETLDLLGSITNTQNTPSERSTVTAGEFKNVYLYTKYRVTRGCTPCCYTRNIK